MNLEKAKAVFTIKDAVTNIMQSVHEVIDISKNIDFKKQCLEVFSVNEFEDLKVDSSRKLTNLLKKRHGLHKKVDKDCLSSNISGSSCSQSSESSFFRSNSNLVEKSEITNRCLVKKCITSRYSPIRKRHRSEPLTSFPKNQIYPDVVSIDTESFQDLENMKFSNASNENVLDTSIISDFIENADLFSKEISNVKVHEKINTKETVTQPDYATINDTSQTPSVQHFTSNEGSPISTSIYGQDSFSLLNEVVTPGSFSSLDDNFEALDNLFFFNQCPKDYSVNL
ncbi:uncharacterized protein LOC124810959 isoform X2 [Hydra vulgaris]|uniref:uncharacterized protein LOC124810959 isoform X2 n=1 Tax=Hydra vulgaris TaxID=6087 RepID=UPI0032EA3F5B